MIAAGSLELPPDLTRRIHDSEVARLVGYPDRRLPSGRVRALAEESRRWFAARGRPWVYVRTVGTVASDGEVVDLADGTRLTSPVLARRLLTAGTTQLTLAAASAGSEVDARSAELWRSGRPDEGYFLDRFGVAVVEYLATWTGRRLRRVAARGGLDALPGYSPGYDGWPLDDQHRIGSALAGNGSPALPAPFEVLASGMLRPKSSLLMVFALTPSFDVAEAAWKRPVCGRCALTLCDHRRSDESDRPGRRPSLDDPPIDSSTASPTRSTNP